jgi:hypothetical protein
MNLNILWKFEFESNSPLPDTVLQGPHVSAPALPCSRALDPAPPRPGHAAGRALPPSCQMPHPARPPCPSSTQRPEHRTSASFLSPPPAPFSECRHAPRPLSFPFACCHPRLARPCPRSSPQPLTYAGGWTTPAPHRILLKSFHHHRLPWLAAATMVHRAPSSVESPSRTLSTSRSCRSRPGHRRPPGGAPQRPNTTAQPRFIAPPSTAPHSEPCYPPPCPTGRPCHRGARREDPPPVRSSVRRCAPGRHGCTSRSDRVPRACRTSLGWAELAYGPGQRCWVHGPKPAQHCALGFLFFNFIYISRNSHKILKYVENTK